MIKERIKEASESLLAYLHLSASQATVFIDQRAEAEALIVHIHDESASRRVRLVNEWRGYPVCLVRDATIYPN